MEQDAHFIAERVRHHLKDVHPGGATLEALEDEIWREEFAWHVPIQPDFEPPRLFEYLEASANGGRNRKGNFIFFCGLFADKDGDSLQMPKRSACGGNL